MSIGPASSAASIGATVDDARATRHRVDAEARPREIGERQPGHDVDVDAPRSRSSTTVRSATAGLPGTA